MNNIRDILLDKREELHKLITMIEKHQAGYPKGSLRTTSKGKQYAYYHYLPEKRGKYPYGKYISKNNASLIHALAQKEYDASILPWARNCLVRLDRLLAVYQDGKCIEVYEALGKARKPHVTPYELSDEMYAQRWLNIPYTGKELAMDSTCFITDRGERVRSKSEKIIADKFNKAGILYKYEHPLLLKQYGTIYPDFTILNQRTREVWYWEHLGMMDNPEYAQKAVMKIQSYEQDGIFPGKGLLLSYEVKNNLNMNAVDALIQGFLV